MNNQSSWFFGRRNLRKSDDIDGLWEIFKIALKFADAGEDGPNAQEFITKFDLTIAQFKVAWSLTIGLYWIRPWEYAPLDQNTRSFVASRFSLDIPKEIGPKGLDGLGYLELLENLRSRFSEPGVQVRSFPELSLAARSGDGALVDHLGDEAIDEEESPYAETATEYGIGNIVTEGCFVPKSDLKQILDRLRDKKNIILQGPPGTGKTWLSKKLAFALMEQRDGKRLTAVQFHPTLSYEDFVRGWRPTASGQLSLVDGPLMLAVQKAADKPGNKYVVVIEEINRGNPAQIFGEMLTLMEKDKRNPESGLSLSHMKEDEPPIYLPDNLYLIGTMNIADRSLALVDLALRRRFAFIDLTPQFNSAWARWLKTEGGIEPRLVEAIRERMVRLNKAITEDDALGSNLAVGHSYLTPGKDERIDEPLAWFRAVIDTEIGPLLEEYWFDRPERAKEEKDRLLAGW
jgi:5-methylcytosine-specific restriction protein B